MYTIVLELVADPTSQWDFSYTVFTVLVHKTWIPCHRSLTLLEMDRKWQPSAIQWPRKKFRFYSTHLKKMNCWHIIIQLRPWLRYIKKYTYCHTLTLAWSCQQPRFMCRLMHSNMHSISEQSQCRSPVVKTIKTVFPQVLKSPMNNAQDIFTKTKKNPKQTNKWIIMQI